MKSKALILFLFIFLVSCSNSIEFSEQFKKETAGNYLYNLEELIKVSYVGNTLYLNWKGGKIKPVVTDENEFFVADMYTKLHFVQHPETKERYLSKIQEDNKDSIAYNYLKVADTYKTPSLYLKEGNYEKALAGYLEIKKQDSTSSYINEWDFNSKGYQYMRKKDFQKAIDVLKINAALHPNSANVYDSLGEAYLRNGDSLEAYDNYIKTLEINSENKRAQNYIKVYESKSL
ncbi:tetratricopeptide repeat protein [Winogradskyella echinorum]|uniref:Tetratricopeptide repeat protein n=1 Tax=Winogradskyella echinorum TaxID=538189 RepID=A0ABR6Y3U3_9FLAO|nr:tetratricopeptide repeat protein [Winogradskyella echinorum]MBC3846920.1 tetratricopeptide repeat protein [Winogradskyella echinorum]MBC5751268.1 tetratricopeptide repeat protein [Winogradskyella echinorum]